MPAREPNQAASRPAPDDAAPEQDTSAGRRRRRHDEAGIQSLVRRLATQLSQGRDR